MRFSFPVISLFVLSLLAGCGVSHKAVRFTPPQGTEVSRFDHRPAIMQSHDKVLGMTAKVSMVSPSEKWFFKLGVFVQLPDKLRIELIPVFGLPDFFLTVKENRFRAFLPKKQEFIIGTASPENLSPFLPMLWGPEEWITVLLGICPQETPYPRQVSFFLPDGQQQEIRYTWGWRFEDMEIPENITFNTRSDTTVSIIYTHFQAYKNEDDELFNLPIPDDFVTVYEWD